MGNLSCRTAKPGRNLAGIFRPAKRGDCRGQGSPRLACGKTEVLTRHYRSHAAAITPITSRAGTTNGGTNQARMFTSVWEKKARRSAGLSLFERSRSLLLLWLADRFVGAWLVSALVLLLVALLRITLGLLWIGGRSGLLLGGSRDRTIGHSIDPFKRNLNTH
jgi:hypothetical protein